MVPKLGPKRDNRMPSPMNLIKKRGKCDETKIEEIELDEKHRTQTLKQDKDNDKDIYLDDLIYCNSDEEHDPTLFQLKLDEAERSPKKRGTIRMNSKILENEAKPGSTNNVLRYKISISNESLYHLKNNSTIINFMKNSSDKNVAKLYKELNSLN
jgi:hypothetical protein